jgi:hypothetical protein
MTVKYHADLVQGSDEWIQIRRGKLTASEVHLIISPPPEPETRVKKNGEPYKQREWEPVADNEKVRAHLWELLAQRTTQYVEPQYWSDDMLRGTEDEIEAREIYSSTYAPVELIGFITNDKWGFTLGYSPDGLVGADGLVEFKSRKQRFQIETIINGEVPSDFIIQCQTGLLVSEREWIDFGSVPAMSTKKKTKAKTPNDGLPMVTIRVFPDPVIQEAIVAAATAFEARLAEKMDAYAGALASKARLVPTERRIVQEMYI